MNYNLWCNIKCNSCSLSYPKFLFHFCPTCSFILAIIANLESHSKTVVHLKLYYLHWSHHYLIFFACFCNYLRCNWFMSTVVSCFKGQSSPKWKIFRFVIWKIWLTKLVVLGVNIMCMKFFENSWLGCSCCVGFWIGNTGRLFTESLPLKRTTNIQLLL